MLSRWTRGVSGVPVSADAMRNATLLHPSYYMIKSVSVNGVSMLEIPKFYIYDDKKTWKISHKPFEGSMVHPAFEGRERMVISKETVKNEPREGFRTMNIYEWGALQTLVLMELAQDSYNVREWRGFVFGDGPEFVTGIEEVDTGWNGDDAGGRLFKMRGLPGLFIPDANEITNNPVTFGEGASFDYRSSEGEKSAALCKNGAFFSMSFVPESEINADTRIRLSWTGC